MNSPNFHLLKKKKLAPKRIDHGSLSHWRISTSVKYKIKHTGHSNVAFNIPVKEKNNDSWPKVTFPNVFLKSTCTIISD